MDLQQIKDFKLPNGGLYTGEYKDKFGLIELCGQGEIIYPGGVKYVGSFNYGRPFGLGMYKLANGEYHKGYFDDMPYGPGYIYQGSDMALGMYLDGELNGWGLKIVEREFVFGFWKNDRLIQDETDTTLWIRAILSQNRGTWKGNLIQFSKEELGYIHLGYPQRTISSIIGEVDMPAVGFRVHKDGRIVVGTFISEDGKNGEFAIYHPNRTIEYGYYENGEIYRPYELKDLQFANDYIVQGLNVFASN